MTCFPVNTSAVRDRMIVVSITIRVNKRKCQTSKHNRCPPWSSSTSKRAGFTVAHQQQCVDEYEVAGEAMSVR